MISCPFAVRTASSAMAIMLVIVRAGCAATVMALASVRVAAFFPSASVVARFVPVYHCLSSSGSRSLKKAFAAFFPLVAYR